MWQVSIQTEFTLKTDDTYPVVFSMKCFGNLLLTYYFMGVPYNFKNHKWMLRRCDVVWNVARLWQLFSVLHIRILLSYISYRLIYRCDRTPVPRRLLVGLLDVWLLVTFTGPRQLWMDASDCCCSLMFWKLDKVADSNLIKMDIEICFYSLLYSTCWHRCGL